MRAGYHTFIFFCIFENKCFLDISSEILKDFFQCHMYTCKIVFQTPNVIISRACFVCSSVSNSLEPQPICAFQYFDRFFVDFL